MEIENNENKKDNQDLDNYNNNSPSNSNNFEEINKLLHTQDITND